MNEDQGLLEIRAEIAAMPHIQYSNIQDAAGLIRAVVNHYRVNGRLALALVGAEMAQED
jgi:hypothetical protein